MKLKKNYFCTYKSFDEEENCKIEIEVKTSLSLEISLFFSMIYNAHAEEYSNADGVKASSSLSSN